MKSRFELAKCGVNISEAINHYGSEQAYFKLLRLFIEDGNIELVSQFIKTRDKENALNALSALSLSFELLFCTECIQKIDELKTMIEAEQWEFAEKEFSFFIENYGKIKKAVSELD